MHLLKFCLQRLNGLVIFGGHLRTDQWVVSDYARKTNHNLRQSRVTHTTLAATLLECSANFSFCRKAFRRRLLTDCQDNSG